MNITAKDLKSGKRFIFQTKDKEDLREAEIAFRESRMGKKFSIWFNGSLIHNSITFESMLKRFETLKNKWELEFERIEE